MKPELIQEVRIDDLPEGDLRHIANVIGVANAVQLILKAPGIHVYIAGNALNRFRERWILENKGRYNPKEMALELNCSQQWVYGILKQNCNGVCENQMGMFEE